MENEDAEDGAEGDAELSKADDIADIVDVGEGEEDESVGDVDGEAGEDGLSFAGLEERAKICATLGAEGDEEKEPCGGGECFDAGVDEGCRKVAGWGGLTKDS